jgi:hypothetical protein
MTASGYWPWWLGAVSLAIVTVGSCIVARRPLGVSGIVARFVDLRAELRAERQRRAMAENDAALEAMLLAATAEAFGPAAAAPLDAAPDAAPSSAAAPAGPCGGACRSAAERPTIGAHAVFLLAIVAGGFVAQLARGAWRPTLDMGPTFASLFGTGARAAATLVVGGLLVGLGTTLSGGCSTGHGLSGCSRLQPASVAATAVFLSSAIAVSFLIMGSIS